MKSWQGLGNSGMLPVHSGQRSTDFIINIQSPQRSWPSSIGRPILRCFLFVIGSLIAVCIIVPMLYHIPLLSDRITDQLEKNMRPSHLRPYPPPRPQPKHDARPHDIGFKANSVRDAFVHAWEGYQKNAMGHDELLPVSGGNTDHFNGWGVTLFDALDTMWIMNFHNMFQDSLSFVAKSDFSLDKTAYAPFFETVIRYLGGLLSAYALSGEPVLLSRADDLGQMLLPAFNTSSGLPMFAVNTITGNTRIGWSQGVLWSEALSNQMEYKYLAHLTGRADYFNKTERIMQLMYSANVTDNKFPTKWNLASGLPSNSHFSVGAFADSAHEYLLKQWLLSGQSEEKSLKLYLKSMDAIIHNLLFLTPTRGLLYVTDTEGGVPTHQFEHLSCFLPGLLALGVHTLADRLTPRERELHGWAAHGLALTCWMTYADQATGLGPDIMQMNKTGVDGNWMNAVTKWEAEGKNGPTPGIGEVKAEYEVTARDYWTRRTSYLLRPETVESFYILWRTTGNSVWRKRGWSIFESIEKYARTEHGFASVDNVDTIPPPLKNEMPSYFLAETLKYLYLLFIEDDILPLKYWVFNTEAHPLPVFNWSSWEKELYNVS